MKKSFGAKTLFYPTPVWCAGTYDQSGNPNIMTVAWCGICSSKPPCVTISIRNATATYENILKRQAFTLSVPSEGHAVEADYIGITPGSQVDKFKAAGLTPQRAEFVDAPYVDEFPMVMECKLIHQHEIESLTMFIGEILDVKVGEEFLNSDGLPDVEKVRPFIFSPEILEYHGIGKKIGPAFKMGKKLKKADG